MENNEYWNKVRQNFYKQVRETNWGQEEDRIVKSKGRKPKPVVRYEAVPRTANEIKQQKYNWL